MPMYNLERHLTRESALAARRGALNYGFCLSCHFAFNASFVQPEMDYLIDYEASRSHSRVFQAYLERLSDEVGQTCAVAGKRVVEVGCGDGQFLLLLRSRYPFHGYGFDPSLSTAAITSPFEDVRFIHGSYAGGSLPTSPDVVILRHILEHQADPHGFLRSILAQRVQGMQLYIEVPAWEWIVEHRQILAFHYEHCAYFSRLAIQKALESHGVVADRIVFGFAEEYLQYYGSCGASRTIQASERDRQDAVLEKTDVFRRQAPRMVKIVKELLQEYPDAVLWGAAGKGTTFLTLLDIDCTQIAYVVDSNPRRQNTFIPVTGQRVVAPEFLKSLQPRTVIVTNPLYAEEIRVRLETIGVRPTFVSVDELFSRAAKELDAEPSVNPEPMKAVPG